MKQAHYLRSLLCMFLMVTFPSDRNHAVNFPAIKRSIPCCENLVPVFLWSSQLTQAHYKNSPFLPSLHHPQGLGLGFSCQMVRTSYHLVVIFPKGLIQSPWKSQIQVLPKLVSLILVWIAGKARTAIPVGAVIKEQQWWHWAKTKSAYCW